MHAGVKLTIIVLTHFHCKDIPLSRCNRSDLSQIACIGMAVAQNHSIPRVYGTCVGRAPKDADLVCRGGKKAPVKASTSCCLDVDVDLGRLVSSIANEEGRTLPVIDFHFTGSRCGKLNPMSFPPASATIFLHLLSCSTSQLVCQSVQSRQAGTWYSRGSKDEGGSYLIEIITALL
jgi:hypothetical protein